jgi:hypothetical protein
MNPNLPGKLAELHIHLERVLVKINEKCREAAPPPIPD